MTRTELRDEIVDTVIKYETAGESEKANLMYRLYELAQMFINGNYEEDTK